MDSMPASSSAATSASNSLDGRGGSDYLNLGMFGQPSGVGDILLGGFPGSLINGYETGGSSSVTSGAPASTTSSAFDLNDFPTLGAGGGSIGGSASSSTLAAALRQQQQQQQQALAHQQMLQGAAKTSNTQNLYRLAMQSGSTGGQNFTIATEDFPALPGAPSGGGSNGSVLSHTDSNLLLSGNGISGLSLSGSGNSFGATVSRTSVASGSLYSGELENNQNQGDGALLGGSGMGALGALQLGPSNQPTPILQQRSLTQNSVSTTGLPSAPGVASVVGSALGGDFGLLGLLSVIRMTDADRNALALGTDLTMLAMNFNSGENLYTTFSSPWSEVPASKETHYQVC
jgi:CCR4-NOT transcription complex subunit 2